MEDNIKKSKVEYLRNNWSDLPQILKLSLGDQTKIKSAWKMTSKYQKLSISRTTDQIFVKF